MKILVLVILLVTLSGCLGPDGNYYLGAPPKQVSAEESEREVRAAVAKFCDGTPSFRFPSVAGRAYVAVDCLDSKGVYHQVGYMIMPVTHEVWTVGPAWHTTK